MRIGAHVKSAGGLDKAIDRGRDIGAEAVQLFVSSPQGWAFKERTEAEIAAFRKKSADTGIAPAFLHGVYLVNLATDKPENLAKSIASLTFYLRTASLMGASGVIFHVGNHGGQGLDAVLDRTVEAIRRVLGDSPEDVRLCLETNAGQGGNIGVKFSDLARIIEKAPDPRLRVCLDTAHTLASGYDIRTPEGVTATMAEFQRDLGLDMLAAVHANDSKAPLGSNVDRHENIGKGHIGEDGFRAVLAHPAFRDVPFFLEVPGYDDDGPDAPNVAALKALRDEVKVPA
jgi:deoxyribonuclease-4